MSSGVTLAFAFGAGLTTFAAPCVFPLLPGYVGYYADQHGGRGTVRPLRQGLAAAAGVLGVFGALTAAVYALDTSVISSLDGLEPLAGGVLVVLGVVMLAGYAPSIHIALPPRRDTTLGVFFFGGVYAVAAAGCTVPILLAVVAQALAMAPFSGGVVLLAYAGGVALPMVVTTVAVGYGADMLTDGVGISSATLTRLAGVVMLAAGALQVRNSLPYGLF
ncbi:cytochrome c biogenesis CcdA family protein [Haloarcula laminariae]|uniref:cytochrome c biogenesis CcdA family protein n=1 Tax=Haloarcula laminariae TaxID=2961577 RepID=UPI0024051938|nr:cytochrome c biogenesis protein CcdA [Halomicroarcula sp. FL173]